MEFTIDHFRWLIRLAGMMGLVMVWFGVARGSWWDIGHGIVMGVCAAVLGILLVAIELGEA